MARYALIEHDGAYYADLARSLLAGDFARGWSTVWPPLEPMAIAAVALLGRALGFGVSPESLEMSARAFSIACGVALLVPTWLLARRLLPAGLAVVACALVASHSRLVQYSAAALTEAPFLLALAGGLAAWLRGRPVVAGIAFGLAYLTRPEGLLLAGLLLGSTLLPGRRGGGSTPRTSRPGQFRLRFCVALFLVVAPYATWVSLELGRPSLGEKGDYNFWRAHRGVSARHFPEPRALAERVNSIPSVSPPAGPREFNGLALFLREPVAISVQTFKNLLRIVTSSYPIAVHPIFALLALLALWRLPRARWHPLLLVLLALPFLYAPFSVDRRFFVPAIPFVLLLATRGIVVLARAIARRFTGGRGAKTWATALAATIVCSQVLYFVTRGQALDRAPELRAAGTWLRTHGPAHPLVQSRGPWVGFYADGATVPLRDESPDSALAAARRRGVDVLVIARRSLGEGGSPLRALLDPGRAPSGLRLIHGIDLPDTVRIYQVERSNPSRGLVPGATIDRP